MAEIQSPSAHTLPQVQGGTWNDPVFDLVLIIEAYDKQRFVAW
jgi:hypothetical protein